MQISLSYLGTMMRCQIITEVEWRRWLRVVPWQRVQDFRRCRVVVSRDPVAHPIPAHQLRRISHCQFLPPNHGSLTRFFLSVNRHFNSTLTAISNQKISVKAARRGRVNFVDIIKQEMLLAIASVAPCEKYKCTRYKYLVQPVPYCTELH